ncbi:MAG: ArsR family transcriptional regulator [Thermoplasmatales archaeon]|jgi:predicted ArsR family transcriptional regulator|nr:ArsR family transcriptional regulator [Candidatus Thermoplasmatota archaeon]MCL6002132.1 ArsR family transcriptional regulator [Candidatus Thermoplasmatota archaeon]MDA8056174.1 ArsR family transcriptional regulator [Thermoplasmatales archaeon]
MEEIATLGASKQRILKELLEKPRVIYELSDKLDIRSNAVREHLNMLEGMGYVESKFIKTKVGRPKKTYNISSDGMKLFPKKYDLLLKILLDELTSEKGVLWVRDFLKRAGKRIVKEDETKFKGISELLTFYNNLGCMATAIEKDGNIVIKRNNCIYYSLALETNNVFCGTFEDALIESMLPSYKVTKKDTVSKDKYDCEITLTKSES